MTGERPEPTFLITKPFREEAVKAIVSQVSSSTSRPSAASELKSAAIRAKIIQGVKLADEFDVIGKADRPSSPKPPSAFCDSQYGHHPADQYREPLPCASRS